MIACVLFDSVVRPPFIFICVYNPAAFSRPPTGQFTKGVAGSNTVLAFSKPISAKALTEAPSCDEERRRLLGLPPAVASHAASRALLEEAWPSGGGAQYAWPSGGGAQYAWLRAWRQRFECWFITLPSVTQRRLMDCGGSLLLHLGARLDSLLGRRGGLVSPSAECAWIESGGGLEELKLPEFPSVDSVRFTPLPRLLPPWERLRALGGADGEHLAAVPVEHSLGAGAVVGALAATFLLLGARGVSRLRSGRPAMRAGARCHSIRK
jgi:hypothetical protein